MGFIITTNILAHYKLKTIKIVCYEIFIRHGIIIKVNENEKRKTKITRRYGNVNI